MSQLDWVLSGGEVVDGTGAPRRHADVGISGDRIAEVAPPGTLKGRNTLDCKGFVVAPAFLDTHSHSDLKILVEPDLPPKVRQGVGLEVLGQDGISVTPVKEEDVADTRRRLAGLDGDPPVSWAWRDVRTYLDEIDRVKPHVDMTYLIPHGAVRAVVMGMENRHATPEEVRKMVALVEQGLEQGALGISTGLIYPPCVYGNAEELIELCKPVAKRDGAFVIHMRSESDYILDGVEECLQICRASGVRLHISHFKIAGRENWGRVEELIAKVEEARRSGIEVTADQYPYIAGSTMLGAILPPWMHEGGVDKVVERLNDKATRARIRSEMQSQQPSHWDNFWKWSRAKGIILADVPSGRRPEVVGKTLEDAANAAGVEALDFALDLLASERLGVAMVSFSQSDDVVDALWKLPWVNACTDGLLGGRPHPRAFGTYPRILGRQTREKKLTTLEEAVRKMTSQAARAMRLKDHGVVEKGKRANLVAFDFSTVIDNATFTDPIQFPTGMRHVVNGGIPVVRDGDPVRGEGRGKTFRGIN
ncbi:MAG: D-aminoacylase [Myxococcota bacterium]